MRYSYSLLSAFEGMDLTSFYMALELSANSRGGLTSRYLSAKLETSEETINYIYKLYPKLFFFDLNRVKVVPEALPIIRRVQDNLNSLGDINSIYKSLQNYSNSERRELEQKLKINRVIGWMSLANEIIENLYKTPESVLEYVAGYSFSGLAREIFDFLWQSKTGIVPVQQIRQRFSKYNNTEIEEALDELLNQFVLFELFRFNGQNRLNRFISILSEIRHYREKRKESKEILKQQITPTNIKISRIESCGVSLAERISHLLGKIAVSPLRITSSGQITRADEQRISRDEPENAYPPIETLVRLAEKAGLLAQVDNTLRIVNLEELVNMSFPERLKKIYETAIKAEETNLSLSATLSELQGLKPYTWYSLNEFGKRVYARHCELSRYELKQTKDNFWEYLPSEDNCDEKNYIHFIDNTFFWFGIIEFGYAKKDRYFRISEIGEYLLFSSEPTKKLKEKYNKKQEWIVQPNFEIIVPTIKVDPLQLIWIELFAQKKSNGGPVSIYSITKESFLKGVQSGADPNQFIQYLFQNTRKQQIPDIVISTMEDWMHTVKRVKVRPVILIEAQDSVIIADLMHRKKLSEILHPISPNHTVYSRGMLLSEIKALLEKDGFVVE
ncbi:MAG: helicase-associated domain-containing protein [Candidatus Hydrogenedens sp.]